MAIIQNEVVHMWEVLDLNISLQSCYSG